MLTFNELYRKLVKDAVDHNNSDDNIKFQKIEFDKHHLDCLMNPHKYPVVIQTDACKCDKDNTARCVSACIFDAITIDENGKAIIDEKKCTGCRACIEECTCEIFVDCKEALPIFEKINDPNTPVFAMIAPAYISQFSQKVSSSMLRSAFKQLGFSGMIEVALFADILTLKEALEFDAAIKNEDDYVLTSCCCPIWISLIRKSSGQLFQHIPPSVSPMVACGRTIKRLYPNAVTVFIGPCLAKKAEAREEDIADAVDFVLTFQEVADIFDATGINPEEMPEDIREHSSKAGRIYAKAGGVSEAVKNTVERLNPNRRIGLKYSHTSGVADCRKLLKELEQGNITANFIEGMGCVGGCVGGPKTLIPTQDGTINVTNYADHSKYTTPIDNPFVIELLNQLGLEKIEDLLNDSEIFTRHFE